MDRGEIIELPGRDGNQQACRGRHDIEAEEAHRWRRVQQDNVKILADAGNSYSQGLKTFANRLAALGQGRGQIPFRILQSKAGRDDLDRWPGRIANRLGEIRSEEHTSELQSLMRISYAVFCLK